MYSMVSKPGVITIYRVYPWASRDSVVILPVRAASRCTLFKAPCSTYTPLPYRVSLCRSMLEVLDRKALRSMFLLDGAACLSIHVSAPMLPELFLNGPLQVDPRYRPTNGRMVSQCLWSHRALSYSNDISNINININATREVSRREYSKLCENTILKYYFFVRIAFFFHNPPPQIQESSWL